MNLKSLIHHGAHSQSLQQMIKNGNRKFQSNSIQPNTRRHAPPGLMQATYNTTKGNLFQSQTDLTPSHTSSVGNLIGNALDRKQISTQYHH